MQLSRNFNLNEFLISQTAITHLEISINNTNYNIATNTDTTIDTTASMTWGIYYKWATANASNSVRIVQGNLKRA